MDSDSQNEFSEEEEREDEVLLLSSTDLKNAEQKLAMLEDEQLKKTYQTETIGSFSFIDDEHQHFWQEKKIKENDKVEFVSGTKKPNSGEEPKKRKSKWDVSAPAVKTATPPAKAGIQGAGVACTSDSASAAKKAKI